MCLYFPLLDRMKTTVQQVLIDILKVSDPDLFNYEPTVTIPPKFVFSLLKSPGEHRITLQSRFPTQIFK